ncbi:MAG: SulP family inorganic anion transporter [Bacteroidales bacterium]|nr:SulP family inorganic anion transporter [Bacteroidales bacterium]
MTKIFNPKFFSLLKLGIGKKQISTDLLSGIVVGIVALPLGIAFAVASGVSPEKGLITAIVAGFLISFLGGSRIQIGGPTGAFIIIVYGIVEKYGLDGLFISTILAGIILVIFGFLKLGVLLKYFPRPLIVGFTSGIALVIFSTQIKDALGLSIEKVPSGFIDKWGTYFSQISSLNLYAVILTVATILITVFSSKLIRKIPGSFIAIILITIVVQVLDIPVTTIETFFGEIPNNFSFTVPNVTWGDFSQYLVPAFTIAMLGSIESLLSAVVADGMIGGNHRSNTELIAQGIANIVTPFFGGIPATGAIARTATNVKNGGRTPIAGMMHALTLLLITIFLGKWAKLIPMSCLAGILIVISYNMSEWRSFRSILKGSVFDIIVLLSTFLLTVLVDLTVAIEVGIVLSALLFMKRMADIGAKIPEDRDIDLIDDYSLLPKDVSVYEISGPLFFASAKEYTEVLKNTGFNSKVLIIRMRHVPFIDSTGLHNLQDVVHTLKKSDVEIILSGVQEEVFKTLNNSGLVDFISRSNVFDSFKEAIVYSKEIVKNESF